MDWEERQAIEMAEREERNRKYEEEKKKRDRLFIKWISLIVIFFAFLIIGSISYAEFVSPLVKVYQERKRGEAELARADSNRKIKIREAEAEEQSAKALANAEIIRAQGVAEANKIIGDSLKGNEAYLRYLWVQGLQTNQMQTIYVPTEAGLPILEANPNIRKN